ncbi:MAG: hypothetical protein U0R64_01960 [Candidatus Nanopelagicales bacterium]
MRIAITVALTATVATMGMALPASAADASVAVSHPHEGKRCHSKGKVVKVGNKWHRVKLKCTKVRRGDHHVLVWKYHGRA